jgi:ABC-type transporter Mla maintaining outer membrane lipid asymmetry ATPase subunit MlaF
MKKRVALARAVVSDDSDDSERVLMYDEPTAGLDPVASTVVEDLMRSLHSDSMAAASMSMLTQEDDDDSETHPSSSGKAAHASNGGNAANTGNGGDASHARNGGDAAHASNGNGSSGVHNHHVGRMSGISSYIVVTHQHSTIRRAVDRIIFLHKGKVVWEGSVADFDTTEEPIVRQFAEGSLKGPISYV